MSLTTKERNRLVSMLNRTGWSGPAPRSVGAAWLSAVAAHGERTALVSGDAALSYSRLHEMVVEGHRRLIEAGVAPGDVVAIPGDRSVESIVGILSIALSGAVYLPVDPTYPAARRTFMLSDAGARFAVADAAFTELSAQPRMIRMPAVGEIIDAAPEPVPAARGRDDALYIMYTSGSTGTPKGVVIPHRGVLRLVCGAGYMTLDSHTVMLQAAPLGFDASTLEIWGPLLNGGSCVLHDETIPTGPGLAQTIARHGVTAAWLTAALFNAVVDDDPVHLHGLQELLIGGEALSMRHVRRALGALPGLSLINGYGPTECTTFTTTHRIDPERDLDGTSIPIGRPITETQVYILDPEQQLVPFGETGELHVGGLGVGLGYLNRADLNAEKFVPDPFTGNGQLYRTGDLVRYREDTTIEFLGRADSQVKIRGFRIELGEIESALAALPDVRSCAVIAATDEKLGSQLVAYVVRKNASASVEQIRRQLQGTLPEFMVPSVVMFLQSLPVTLNGKLDRGALPRPESQRTASTTAVQGTRGELESAVARALCSVLGLETIGRDDNFFDHGGNSLLAVRAVAELRKAGLGQVPVAMMYRDPTVRGIAARLRAEPPATRSGSDAVAATSGRTPDDRHEAIAIIGMAGRFPGAADVESFWEVLKGGRDTITHFAPGQLDPSVPADVRSTQGYVAARGVIDGIENFDAAFFGITGREAELMDPQQRMFLELCWECLERGGHVPEKYDGQIGVFGGMYNASYFQKHVAAHPEKIANVGEFQVMLANEKDYVATRAAHKLNLRGPAISVNTACSTSLVAIAQAVSSLRNGECGMALAGGVSVTCPPNSGYLYQEGAMLSPDGVTRTFDENAKGTVFSDGGAVVLLKRMSAAIADGNRIYALIRGAAVNNDGSAKASFTAPSVDGQAAVISAALADAGIDARSVSYVEAHGTATPLGDPVEIAGLTQAFRAQTPDTGFCGIGSLKSNMGHLVIAAGAAGVIKTALALENGLIPRSIHYKAPNPQIDFSSTPFVVADQNIPWPRSAMPRRAGVSSFGVGGTNAHLILEEAPQREMAFSGQDKRSHHELHISARTPEALTMAAARLADHLAANPGLDLADVAFTLDSARRDFPWRIGVVATDAGDAASLLRDDASMKRRRRKAMGVPRLAFMFPGQGAQYAGMGSGLHAGSPAFREALEECISIGTAHARIDLRRALFESDERALGQTAITQPATFAIEYALARSWIAAGVRADLLLGHSIGEFAAAVISGVMSLRDGLCLVALRGSLMQSLPVGAMLSVRAGSHTLSDLLPEGLQLAAENSPAACVVSGPSDQIDSFEQVLSGRGIVARRLRTSHAFHSAMMDPIVAPFEDAVRKVSLHAPGIPMVSTVTAAPLEASEATDPGYWARHLRSTVRFSPALKASLAHDCVYLEIGPRTTLTTLARQHGSKDREIRAIASLADSPQTELDSLAAARADLWSHGIQIPASPAPGRSRLRLPTYPFERQRYWVDARASTPENLAALVPPASPPPLQSDAPTAETAMPATAPAEERKVRIATRIRALLDEVAGVEVSPDQDGTTFMELGLDSLSLTQVALQVKKTFGTSVTFRSLMESYRSVSDLADFLDKSSPPDVMPPPVTTPAPVAAPVGVRPGVAIPMPAMEGGPMNASQIQQLIQQQMALMAQQLALLSGVPAMPAAADAPAPTQPAAAMQPTKQQTAAPGASPVPQSDTEKPDSISKYDVKKAFGAIARIHTSSAELSQRQLSRLQQFMARYIEKTRKSKAYTVEHRPHLADPRVVNGFRPQLKEIIYQLVIERSRGSRMWDLDGNEYVDALNGFGMSLFGWQPDFVLEPVRKQLESGYDIGPQHPLAGEVAKLFCEVTGNDRAGLCNTGSEAVMGCVRIARTVTGRSKIAIFTGAYHGIFDEVIVRGTKKLRAIPAAPGIMPNTSENVLVLEYGTPETLQILRENAQDLAAILVEPVQSRRPDFQPVEFLRELRKLTTESGSLLIFDEVVTGFRSHPGGIQALFGIRADLCSYGKVVGGGFPIGVIAGKREFMDALDGGHWEYGDNSIPTVGVTYFAGTFVRHPLALVAAKAVLEHVRKEGAGLQQQLTAATTDMVAELNDFCTRQGAPVVVKSFASVWKVFFTEDHPLQDLLFAMMRNRNIHILDNFPCFMTTAHSRQDIQRIVDAFKEAILEMQESEFLPRRGAAATDAAVLDASKPPVPGARLGKDKDGNPAWFVTKPEAPGKYFKVG